jgi:hypothetical protein
MYIYIFINIYTYVHVYAYIHKYIHIYIIIYKHVHIHVYMYMHTHNHISYATCKILVGIYQLYYYESKRLCQEFELEVD